MESDTDDYRAAYERERRARIEVEQLLEDKTRVLFETNRRLEEKLALLETHQAQLLESEKMATLGTLSAGVAHEINNPLAYVMSNMESLQYVEPVLLNLLTLAERLRTQTVEQTELDAELERLNAIQSLSFLREDLPELLGDSLEGLSRIRDIVHSLLSFARSPQREKDSFDLSEIMQGTLKLLAGTLRDIKLVTRFSGDTCCYCSRSSISQVFVNLLINAIQACEKSASPRIDVGIARGDGELLIDIADNGCGMTPEVVRKMFDPFFTTKAVGVGTGMGMSIVYSVVAEHGGKIQVESEPNKGSRIRVCLPDEGATRP